MFPTTDHATLNLKLPSDRTCISVVSRSRSLHLEAQSTQVRSRATPYSLAPLSCHSSERKARSVGLHRYQPTDAQPLCAVWLRFNSLSAMATASPGFGHCGAVPSTLWHLGARLLGRRAARAADVHFVSETQQRCSAADSRRGRTRHCRADPHGTARSHSTPYTPYTPPGHGRVVPYRTAHCRQQHRGSDRPP